MSPAVSESRHRPRPACGFRRDQAEIAGRIATVQARLHAAIARQEVLVQFRGALQDDATRQRPLPKSRHAPG